MSQRRERTHRARVDDSLGWYAQQFIEGAADDDREAQQLYAAHRDAIVTEMIEHHNDPRYPAYLESESLAVAKFDPDPEMRAFAAEIVKAMEAARSRMMTRIAEGRRG